MDAGAPVTSYKCKFCGMVFSDDDYLIHLSSGSCNADSEHPCVPPLPPNHSPSPTISKSSVSSGFSSTRETSLTTDNFTPNQRNECVNGKRITACENNCAGNSIKPTSLQNKPLESKFSLPFVGNHFSTLEGSSKGEFTSLCMNVGATRRSNMISQPHNGGVTVESVQPPSVNGQSISVPRFPEFSSSCRGSNEPPITNSQTTGMARSQQSFQTRSSDANSSKWKCALCAVDFFEKAELAKHVRDPEHIAKIKAASGLSANSPSRAVLPLQSAEPKSTPKDEMVNIIRQIVREEAPALIRDELRKVFEMALKEPSNESSQDDDAPVHGLSDPQIDDQIVSVRGNGMRCLVCDCLVTSMSNVQNHLEGKKHKANLLKMESSRFSNRFC